jgi:phosphoribosylanthranilate isomerase
MALRWKVCGITRVEDAAAAVEAGADAIGFVFYPPSPRSIDPERAAAISGTLPAEIWRFGVFVDRPAGEINGVVETAGLDFVQLAGDEPPEVCEQLTRHAFKTLRPDPEWEERRVQDFADRYPECTLLVDAAGAYGGSGRPADWGAAATLARWHRLVLAGGLTPDTVADAVRQVRPWAVDVASGVEASPGRKDHEKLRAFARALEPFR